MAPRLYLARSTGDAAAAVRPAECPIRVIVADDHAMVRRGLRLLLSGEHDLQVVAEVSDPATIAGHVRSHAPHVLVLDVGMPGGSSVETIRRMRSRFPDTEIVVLTMEPSPSFAQRALNAGANGFVLKEHADSELPLAIRAAARGEEFVSPRVAARLAALRQGVSGDGLSPREMEVLRLIALGHTSVGIAEQLRVSRRTVESHRAAIHRKLAAGSRAELVQFALKQRLIGA